MLEGGWVLRICRGCFFSHVIQTKIQLFPFCSVFMREFCLAKRHGSTRSPSANWRLWQHRVRENPPIRQQWVAKNSPFSYVASCNLARGNFLFRGIQGFKAASLIFLDSEHFGRGHITFTTAVHRTRRSDIRLI